MKPLNRVTLKVLKKKKKRTAMTIVSIALATLLMVGTAVAFSSYRENDRKQYIAQNGGYHVYVKGKSYSTLSLLESKEEIANIEPIVLLNQFQNKETIKRNKDIFVIGMTKRNLQEINLISGSYPKNQSEILVSSNWIRVEGYQYKVGDAVAFEDHSFTIVGIYDTTRYSEEFTYDEETENFFTFLENPQATDLSNFYIYFDNINEALKKYETIGILLQEEPHYGPSGVSFASVYPNMGLFNFYGEGTNHSEQNFKIGVLIILLTVIGFACSFIIYNSFAVSVSERKKQYGVMRSIGATKGQIFRSVFFEALFVGVLGVGLGIVLVLGIGNLTIASLNYIGRDIYVIPYTLEIFPSFYYLSVTAITVVILLSAYFPAKRSSEITPLEAIRNTYDWKYPKKNRAGKWMGKLFGVEGFLAIKNLKVNKRRYRISSFAIMVSVMILLLGSVFFDFLYQQSQQNYNVNSSILLSVTVQDPRDLEKIHTDLTKLDGVKEVFSYHGFFSVAYQGHFGPLTEELKQARPEVEENPDKLPIFVVSISDQNYQQLKEKYGFSDHQAIFLNRTVMEDIDTHQITQEYQNYQLGETFSYTFCKEGENRETCSLKISDIGVLNDRYLYFRNNQMPTFLFPEEILEQINTYSGQVESKTLNSRNYYVDTSNYMKFDAMVDSLLRKYDVIDISISNELKDMENVRIQLLTMELLAYGIAGILIMIALTSVYASITTSMEARRKDYAILRSLGMTEKGFSKMSFLESLFFVTKAFFWSFLFSNIVFGILNWWGAEMNPGTSNPFEIQYPWIAFWISIGIVLGVVLFIMITTTRKMRQDNLIDVIKEDSY